MDILIQLIGLLSLIVGVAFGYLRWIRPREASLSLQGKGILLLIILTLMGGLIGSTGWWVDDPRSFSWDLPALASRMLAAAAWSFVVLTFMALQRPSYQRVRLTLLMLFTYLTPLAVVAVLVHLNRFDPNVPITYVFFLLVIGMIAATGWYLLRQPALIPAVPQDIIATSLLVKGWLIILAILTGLWGLALFATDNGFSNLIWVWPGDLLTSRLIAVMLLSLAIGAVYTLRYADAARVFLTSALIYGLGLAVAGLWNGITGKPIPISYVVIFGIVFIVSAILLQNSRNQAKS